METQEYYQLGHIYGWTGFKPHGNYATLEAAQAAAQTLTREGMIAASSMAYREHRVLQWREWHQFDNKQWYTLLSESIIEDVEYDPYANDRNDEMVLTSPFDGWRVIHVIREIKPIELDG